MKILHIEDNEDFRRHVAEEILSEHEIDGAEDGSLGINLFDSGNYDIVMLDYQMIEVHGPDVIRHIRRVNKEIPVIANSMEDRLNNELLELGATEAVAKRFVDQLPRIIKIIA